MEKEEYLKITNEKIINEISKKIMIEQINKYYNTKEKNILIENKYSIGDDVFLPKGTLLHGTYKNMDGLSDIVKDGLISSWFIDGRLSKYPSSIGVWNLKQDYYLKNYIDFYSGGTVEISKDDSISTDVVPYSKIHDFINYVTNNYEHRKWFIEQTKEARFLPSLVQNSVQIGLIFNGELANNSKLLDGDILNPNNISDIDVKPFVNENYYERFIKDRINKDDFFTDRESAILFGIPASLIEGILVGREYENNEDILKEIKILLPNCYICNLDGKVIR